MNRRERIADNLVAEIAPVGHVVVTLVGFVVALFVIGPRGQAAEADRGQATEQERTLEKRSCICIKLPPGHALDIDTPRASLVLRVQRDGTVLVAGKLLRDAELDSLFHAVFQRDKLTRIVLWVEGRVAHARVVDLMNRAKAAGLTRFAIGAPPQA